MNAQAAHGRAAFVWALVGLFLFGVWRSRLLPRIWRRWGTGAHFKRWASLACATLLVGAPATIHDLAQGLAAPIWSAGAAIAPSLVQSMSEVLLTAFFGGLAIRLLLVAVSWRPRLGWAISSAVITVILFCAVLLPPVTLVPLARGDRPATAGPSATSLLNFIRKGGLNVDRLYVFDSADPSAVDMEGVAGARHAAVSRAALAAPRAETYAAIGHLLGHYRHQDLWSLALLWSLFAAAFCGCAAIVRRRLTSRSQGEATDARTLPLLGVIAWALFSVGTPIFNGFDQVINFRADDYAMALTRDPDALCRWLVAAEGDGKADPSPLETLIFYDHPPLKARLLNAMRWKAAHAAR